MRVFLCLFVFVVCVQLVFATSLGSLARLRDDENDSDAEAPVQIPKILGRRAGTVNTIEYGIGPDGTSIIVHSAIPSVATATYFLPAKAIVDDLMRTNIANALMTALGKTNLFRPAECRFKLSAAGKKTMDTIRNTMAQSKWGRKQKRARFQQLEALADKPAAKATGGGIGDSRNLLELLKKVPNSARISCTYATGTVLKPGSRGKVVFNLRSFDSLYPDTVKSNSVFQAAMNAARLMHEARRGGKSLLAVESELSSMSSAEGLPTLADLKASLSKQAIQDAFQFIGDLLPPVNPSSYWNTNELATAAVSKLYPYGGISYANLLTWGTTYIAAISVADFPRKYPTWKSSGSSGRFNAWTGAPLSAGQKPAAQANSVNFQITADWGAGTVEADYVAQLMSKAHPDWTLHAGDIYWAGAKVDIKTNCLGYRRKVASNPNARGVYWPTGRLGAFASLGNHEMYNRGDGFFDDWLPNLGLNINGKMAGQKAGYVAIETDKWVVILADTGFKSYAKFNSDAPPKDVDLTPEQIAWLRDDLRIGDPNDKRGVVFLTHHQPVTAFSNDFVGPANTLAKLLPTGRKFVWLFGHEHILAFYTPQNLPNGVSYWGRCIGNGGFPTNIIPLPAKPPATLIAYDSRIYQRYSVSVDANKEWGDQGFDKTFNGWVDVSVSGNRLIVTYKTLANVQGNDGKLYASNSKATTLAVEEFSVDANGVVTNSVALKDGDVNDGQSLTFVRQ